MFGSRDVVIAISMLMCITLGNKLEQWDRCFKQTVILFNFVLLEGGQEKLQTHVMVSDCLSLSLLSEMFAHWKSLLCPLYSKAELYESGLLRLES